MSEHYDDYEEWQEAKQNSPATLVGILVMALTGAAIIGNALLNQPQSAELELMAKAARANSQAKYEQHAQNKAGYGQTQSGLSQRDTAIQNDKTTTTLAVQRELTMAGYYVGPLDGQEGAQTREAIRAFEDAVGLPSTGKVSMSLYQVLKGTKSVSEYRNTMVNSTQLAADPVTTASVPQSLSILPKRKPRNLVAKAAPRAQKKKPSQQATLVKHQRNDVQLRQLVRRQTRSTPVPPAPIPDSKPNATLAKVQAALARFGYAQLAVDGRMGNKTSQAISEFQRLRGHPVTGQVNDLLLKEMMMLGYLDLG